MQDVMTSGYAAAYLYSTSPPVWGIIDDQGINTGGPFIMPNASRTPHPKLGLSGGLPGSNVGNDGNLSEGIIIIITVAILRHAL